MNLEDGLRRLRGGDGPVPAQRRRLSVYLDADVMLSLAHAEQHHQGRSAAAEAVIASFFSPDADERREAAVVKRLDRIDRRMQRLERDLGIAVETLAVFVRFWLALTPQLPEIAQAAARSKAQARYDSFLEALGRRLTEGAMLRREIGEDTEPQSATATGVRPGTT